MTTPENATNVASYEWQLDGTTIVGEVASSYVVKADDKGKTLKVIVTDSEGNKFESAQSAIITEDKSENITLTDASGLQSDGTGTVSDELRVSYGSALGVPKTITWYYNDTVVKAYNSQGGNLTEALYLMTAGHVYWDSTLTTPAWVVDGQAECKDGNYYVVIINEDGKAFTSNSISLVYDELKGTVESFNVQDDLATPENVAHVAEDTKAVLSVTLNKDYEGTFYVYEDSVTKYSQANAATSFDPSALSITLVNTASKLTLKDTIKGATTTVDGLKYVAEDGKTTYMWMINSAANTANAGTKTLTRGKSYKIVFDQDSITTDNIEASKTSEQTASAAVLLNYLPAPTKIAMVSAAKGQAGKVNILGEDGNVLEYMGNDQSKTDMLGFASIVIYGDTDADAAGGTARYASGGDIEKGVYTAAAENKNDDDFYYAVAKTTAGVYGEKAVELTSEAKMKSMASASGATISESKTDPAVATVALKGVGTASTVYVYGGYDYKNNGYSFDPSNAQTYLGSVEVAAGAASAEISKVFTKKDIGTDFYAVVIPKDNTIYATYTGEKFTLKQTATELVYDKAADTNATLAGSAAVGNANTISFAGRKDITVKNQFGDPIAPADPNFDGVTAAKAEVKANDAGGTHAESGTATYSIAAATGYVTFDIDDAKGMDLGDSFDVTFLGSTFNVKAVLSNGGTVYTNYNAKLGSSTVVSAKGDGTTAVSVNSFEGLKLAAATAGTQTITMTGSFSIDSEYTLPANKTLAVVANTLTLAEPLTNSGKITTTTGKIVVAKGKAGTATGDVSGVVGTIVVNDANALALYAAGTYTDGSEPDVELGEDIETAADITVADAEIVIPTGKTLTLSKDLTLNGTDAAGSGVKGAGSLVINKKLTITKGTFNVTGTVTAKEGSEVAATKSNTNAVFTTGTFVIDSGATTNGAKFTDTDATATATVKYQPTGAEISAVTATPITDTTYPTREGAVSLSNDNTNVKIAVGASAAKS